MRASFLFRIRALDESIAAAESVVRHAGAPGWRMHVARAHLAMGSSRMVRGDRDAAREGYTEALRRFESGDPPLYIAAANQGLGLLSLDSGDLDDAADRFAETVRIASAGGVPLMEVRGRMLGAYVAGARGDLDRQETLLNAAEPLLRDTMARAEHIGQRGDSALRRGHAAEARAFYERSLKYDAWVGGPNMAVLGLQIAATLVEEARFIEARERAEVERERIRRRDRRDMMVGANLVLAAAVAGEGTWARWDHLFDEVEAQSGLSDYAAEEDARMAERSVSLATQAGEAERARRARRWARTQWERLGLARRAMRTTVPPGLASEP